MRSIPAVRALLGLAFLSAWAFPVQAAEPVDYARDVKPILQARCAACHGRVQQKSGLRVDAGSLLAKGGDGGPAVEPGNANESLLIEAVTTGINGRQMPPIGKPLTADQVGLLRRWIDEGAKFPVDENILPGPEAHWFFNLPVRRNPPPAPARLAKFIANPIDQFLAANWETKDIEPRGEADKATLLRRVTFDLIGLPPTIEEIEAFTHSDAADAYEALVDRLLASPRYGERWGRHWLDVWRYTDEVIDGPDIILAQRHMWKWRDWVVSSLNSDKGYDRMVQEMLAGDELAPNDESVLAATGFLVRSKTDLNSGHDGWMNDVVEHTGKAFLGLTFNCARCHDHKYDPITHADYYRFRAFFEPIESRTDRVPGQRSTVDDGVSRIFDARPDAGTSLYINGNPQQPDKETKIEPGLPLILARNVPIAELPLPPEASFPGAKNFIRDEDVAETRERLATAEVKLAEAVKKAAAGADPLATADQSATAEKGAQSGPTPEGQIVEVALAELRSAIAAVASIDATIAADDAVLRGAGDLESKKQHASVKQRELKVAQAELAVQAARLEAIKTRAKDAKDSGAAAEAATAKLAKLLEEAEKARKMLAEPAGDYQPLGGKYPQKSSGRRLALARWITSRENPTAARVAVNHVWTRHFQSPIVESSFNFGLNGSLPAHPELLDWLALELMDHNWSLKHLHKLILMSAAYRRESSRWPGSAAEQADADNVTLWRMNPRRLEAEAVRDSLLLLGGSLDEHLGGKSLPAVEEDKQPRRSLYFRTSVDEQSTMLMVFDAADPNECYRRQETVVPQQALALFNSRFSAVQARAIAGRLMSGPNIAPGDDKGFIQQAMLGLVGRAPLAKETEALLSFLDRQQRIFGQLDSGSNAAIANEASVNETPAQMARISLIHVLLNHNEFVTVR